MLLPRIACAIALTIGAMDGASAQKAATPFIELTAKGEIQIAPDGHVNDYQLKSDLTPTITALVDRTVRGWHFEPILVDGKAVTAKTTMTLHLHGEPVSGDSYSISIASVHFGSLTRSKLDPPEYPHEALRAGLGARVELSLLIDADGKVLEAIPFQTSLDKRARTELEAEAWRKKFENASVRAVKKWRYDPSEIVDGKPPQRRYAVVPIVFGIHGQNSIAYVPGPVHPAPWDKTSDQTKDEARLAQLSNGETAATNSNFRLKDDVVGKTL